jgi:origin recognition complex subunit 4
VTVRALDATSVTRPDMPAKRKASTSQALDEPIATRRRTCLAAPSLTSPSRNSLQHSTTSSPASRVRSPISRPSAESTTLTTPTRKESERRLTRSQIKAPAVIRSVTPRRVSPSDHDQEGDSSQDELLLSPSKKVTSEKRPENPPTKLTQLPRVYVEIVSPAPRSSKRIKAKIGTSPASPTPTPSKAVRRVSPSSPLSPTKAATKRMKPSKPLGRPSLHDVPSSPLHNSSIDPSSCLHAQKRAILHALHRPETAVFDQEDENREPSANAVALEQLKALLTGTLERGEGNSCLLIGPRGSGKSRVSVIHF